LFANQTSGAISTEYTSSTKLQYTPSSGLLAATTFSGSGANLTNIPNAALTNSSITIGSTAVSLGGTITTIAGLTSVTSTTFVGALTGNADTATSATTATNATNIAITDNTSSVSTYYPVISSATTGNVGATTSSTKISFVPSTGVLTVNAITSAASTALTLQSAGTTAVTVDTSQRVGIGTTSPGTILDVQGNSPTIKVLATNLSGATTSLELWGSAAGINYKSAVIQGINYGQLNLQTPASVGVNSFITLATTAVERMRITSAGGISFGSTGTAYGTSGQVLTSAGNAPPTWTSTASININGTVGATTASTGAFTTVSATGVITSTLTTGTAPFTVASTTQVANLNAATAGTATTATNATNSAITDDVATSSSVYPAWVTATTGNLPIKTSSTKLSFTPSTGALRASQLVIAP
jgi:hypothetical protein